MVLSTTPPRAPRRWATPAATGLFAVAIALSGVTFVNADDKPKDPPAAPQPPDAPKPADAPKPRQVQLRVEVTPSEDKPADAARAADPMPPRATETRLDSRIVRGLRLEADKVAELKKKIDEAIAAGKTDETKKLVDALIKSLTQPFPVPPTPPTPPQLPARERRGTLAIEVADPRIADALKAMQKALEATKDPEARAAVESAFKLLRDMPQDRKLTQTVIGDDGRATVVQHGATLNGVGGIYPGATLFAPYPGAAAMPTPNAFGSRSTSPIDFGVVVVPVPEALAEQLQLPAGSGLVVNEIRPDLPFAKAGVKKSDVITAVGSVRLTNGVEHMRLELSKAKPGKLAVTVISKGVEKTVEVELPQPKLTLARPAAKKLRFESKSVSVNNDDFTIDAKAGVVEYKITGKLNAGKVANYDAIISEGGKPVTVLRQRDDAIDLTESGLKYRAAVNYLLNSVRGD